MCEHFHEHPGPTAFRGQARSKYLDVDLPEPLGYYRLCALKLVDSPISSVNDDAEVVGCCLQGLDSVIR